MAVRVASLRDALARGKRRMLSNFATTPNSAIQNAMAIQPNRMANRKRKNASPAVSPSDCRMDQSLTTAAAVEDKVRNRKSHRRRARPTSGTAFRDAHRYGGGKLGFFHQPSAQSSQQAGRGPGDDVT